MNRSPSVKIIPYIFIAPTFILIFIFSYYAIFLAVVSSFQDFHIGFKTIWIGLENYKQLFTDKIFSASLLSQIIFTIFSVFFNIFFPLLAAELLFFIRHEKISKGIRTAFVVPMLVPGIVTILIWRYLYNPSFGINSILKLLGLDSLTRDWMNTPSTALMSVIFVGFPFVSGLYFLVFHSGINSIGQDLHEAAYIDGASSIDIVFRIHLSCLLPYIKVVFSLSLIGSLSGYGQVAATTAGGPGYSSYIPSYYMYKVAFGDGNMGYASTMGVVIFVLLAVLTLVSRKLIKTEADDLEG